MTIVIPIRDDSVGLQAFIAIDSVVSRRAAGGVRTLEYATEFEAIEDAKALARAMSLKCAAAGLPCGGCKTVVIADKLLDRQAAFVRLGQVFEQLGGVIETAGDLGTTGEDLSVMAQTTQFVQTDETNLGNATAKTVLVGIDACLAKIGKDRQAAKVLVQGCGSMGSVVSKSLASQCQLLICDIDEQRARDLAAMCSADVVPAENCHEVDCDIWSPCGPGGVIDAAVAQATNARAVCGAANNIVQSDQALEILHKRGVWFVPDVLSSSGAVIVGIATKLGLTIDEHYEKVGAVMERVLDANAPATHALVRHITEPKK